jgi:fructoselysine-6-P-deglycase FrlB-like protein
LNPDGALAKHVPSLIGAGGAELAFAATRSVLISQALHAAVLADLGADMRAALAVLQSPAMPSLDAALAALSAPEIIILSGRSALQGVAESGALCLMELARIPTYALEGGQFRHGPMELLGPQVGVILMRPSRLAPGLTAGLAESARAAGCPVVVFDASGAAPIEDAVTISLPEAVGLAACFAALPPLQHLLVEIAARKVPDLGTPLRSSKVTTAL